MSVATLQSKYVPGSTGVVSQGVAIVGDVASQNVVPRRNEFVVAPCASELLRATGTAAPRT